VLYFSLVAPSICYLYILYVVLYVFMAALSLTEQPASGDSDCIVVSFRMKDSLNVKFIIRLRQSVLFNRIF